MEARSVSRVKPLGAASGVQASPRSLVRDGLLGATCTLAISPHAFVPDDYVVPLSLSGPGFRLEPLGPQHNIADHRA